MIIPHAIARQRSLNTIANDGKTSTRLWQRPADGEGKNPNVRLSSVALARLGGRAYPADDSRSDLLRAWCGLEAES